DAQQVEDLLHGAHAPGEHDDAVGDAHESLQALLDVRHDHQLVDDGVGGFRGDDAGLADTDVAAVLDLLLGVAHGGPLHGAFHGADAAAGDDVQAPKPQLVAHLLGVVVFLPGNGVAAPAHHQVGGHVGAHHPGVAEDAEHAVGELGRGLGLL